MTQPIELFYDFRSPYSYLAFTQLRGMNVDIALRPMKVLTLMEKVGINVAQDQPGTPPEPTPESLAVKPAPFRRPPSKIRSSTHLQ